MNDTKEILALVKAGYRILDPINNSGISLSLAIRTMQILISDWYGCYYAKKLGQYVYLERYSW